MTRGAVLGKFHPPHRGHALMIEFARRMCDDLTVIVATLEREEIPGGLRHAWVSRMFPDLRVVHVTDENPQLPHEHPDFWAIWKATMERALPAPIQILVASEDYGAPLAACLGARFVPTPMGRSLVPISATMIRQAPLEHWDHLPEPVRVDFLQRVCIFGPESTGKTTLAQRLAEEFTTVWVPEYARQWLEARAGAVEAADLELIAQGQWAAEQALATRARRLLFCDTGTLTTSLWSRWLFDSVSPRLLTWAGQGEYALTLLCHPDVPFVEDPVRYLPHRRQELFEDCRAALRERGRPTVELRAGFEERYQTARAAVEALLRNPILSWRRDSSTA